VHAAESSIELKMFFGNEQSLYVVFSASPARWKILLEETGISLHCFSTTRWGARIDAIRPLIQRPREIMKALQRAKNELALTGEMLAQEKLLKKWLKSFETVLLLTIWVNILQCVNDVSRLLQSQSISIEEEVKLLHNLVADLTRIKSSWKIILEEAKKVAENLDFDSEFSVRRKKRSKRFHDE